MNVYFSQHKFSTKSLISAQNSLPAAQISDFDTMSSKLKNQNSLKYLKYYFKYYTIYKFL